MSNDTRDNQRGRDQEDSWAHGEMKQQDSWERKGVNTKTVFENTTRYLIACTLDDF